MTAEALPISTGARTEQEPSPVFQFTKRDLLIVLLIILIAFSYRAMIIWDRAIAPDNSGAFNPLPEGADQSTYYNSIFSFREGTYPPPTFHFQPGMSYFLIGLTALIGSTDLLTIRLALAVLAAINCGLLYAVAQLAFENRRVSIIAAVLLAFYPVAAFYDTDLVITSQAVILLTIAVLGAFWMLRMPRRWVGALLLGFVIGAGAITRLEAGVAALALAGWVFLVQLRARKSLLPFALTALAALAFIAPVALHNRQGGADFLLTPVGTTEIYRGFNRDANGVYVISRADVTTGFEYPHYLGLDVQLEPVRFVGLMLRKLGLLLSATEPGNNLSYPEAGEAISPALRLNPLDFRVLIVLAAFGLMPVWRDKRKMLMPFLIVGVVMLLMTMLIWIEARIRTPIIVAMIPLAAYGINDLWLNGRTAAYWRKRVPLVGLLLVGLLAAWTAENYLPRDVTVPTLPADATPVGALYNDELRLVGYDIEDQYTPAGRIEPFRPYVVTLYWMLEQPTDIDYSYALKLVVDDALVDQFDHPLGYVNYPWVGTSEWEPGRIYVEHVGMTTRRFDDPAEISGHLWLEVYPERDTSRLLEPVGSGASPLELARPAVMRGEGMFETLDAVAADMPDQRFGDLMTLDAWSLPETGETGQPVNVTLGWRTTDTQIEDSHAIGLYLQNENGEFVTNFDSPPRGGRLLTSSLPTNYRLEDARTIMLPATPGDYRVYVAVYRQSDGLRLPLNDTGDTMALIGTIHAE